MYSSNIVKTGMGKGGPCDFLSEYKSVSFDCAEDNKIKTPKEKKEKCPEKIILKAKKCAAQIIKEGKEESDNIIIEAKRKAEIILMEEKEKGREIGFNEGYKFGEKSALETGYSITEELKSICECLAGQRDAFLENNKELIIGLAFDIASKIVSDDFFGDKGAFYKVFEEAVKQIPPAKKLMLTVSDSDFEIATHNKEELLEIAKDFETIEIKRAGYDETGLLMLESPIMLVDASLNLQLELLKSSLS